MGIKNVDKPNKFVKIVLTEERYDDDYSTTILREGISNWEEITHDEYVFLRDNLFRITQNNYAQLIVQDEVPVRVRIDNIRKAIQVQQAKAERERLEREAKAKEREQKKLLKKAKSEQALYEDLKKKFEKSGK